LVRKKGVKRYFYERRKRKIFCRSGIRRKNWGFDKQKKRKKNSLGEDKWEK
jgi:hypothetical protein